MAHVTESLMLMLLLTTMMMLLLTPVTDDFADPIFTVRVEFELGFFVVDAAEARLLRLGMMIVIVVMMTMNKMVMIMMSVVIVGD